jgi:hypothetical protein
MSQRGGDPLPSDRTISALNYAAARVRRVVRAVFALIVVGVFFLPFLPIVAVGAVAVILLLFIYSTEVKAAGRLVRKNGLRRVRLEDVRRRRSVRDRGWILLFDVGPPLDSRESPRQDADLYLAGDPEKGRVALAQFAAGATDVMALNLLWPSRRASTEARPSEAE